MTLQTQTPSAIPVPFMTFPQGGINLASSIFNIACHDPQRLALLFQEQAQEEFLTYGELARQIATVAEQFQSLGLEKGDRVGLLLYNTPTFVASYFAALGLGFVIVPLNTRLTALELETILQDSQARFLITAPRFLPVVQGFCPGLPLEGVLLQSGTKSSTEDELANSSDTQAEQIDAISRTKPVYHLNDSLSSPVMPDFPSPWHPTLFEKDTLAVLIYTSGTTGKPKGVMLSHGNILADAAANVAVIEAGAADRFISISPLFHVFGQTNILVSAMLAGASIVLIPKFSPRSTLEAIARYRVTFMAAVPTMYLMMLSHLRERPYVLSSLRVCHSGASPMAVDTFHAVESAFGAPVQEGYGLSEASSIVCCNPLHGERKPGSVGLPLPGVQVRVMAESDREALPGEIGELQVIGDIVMLGYYQQAGWTEKAFSIDNSGVRWLKTKDLGYKDDDGYLYIVDREDDLINIGGVKVYPREIEEVIHRHPAVQAVAVTGLSLSLNRETIKAFVELYPGENCSKETLQTFCRPFLSDFKIPRHVEFVDEIPQGATGKILRRALRARAMEVSEPISNPTVQITPGNPL